jgi:hypothetical protein
MQIQCGMIKTFKFLDQFEKKNEKRAGKILALGQLVGTEDERNETL